MNELIDRYSHAGGNNPFLKHVAYFNEDGSITTNSIKNKWHELTGESKWTTWAKGYFTIRGANRNLPSGCPYQHSFQTAEIMPCLKHPCDTGIVQKDGNINIDVLRNMMYENFKYSTEYSCYYLTKSQMAKYLSGCTTRDKDIDSGTGVPLVSWSTVAWAEWDVFYDTFCDFEIGDDKAITADTFLQFYFDCDKLYQRALSE
jgi:hypothetical protein